MAYNYHKIHKKGIVFFTVLWYTVSDYRHMEN